MRTKGKDILILVEGDDLSKQIFQTSKNVKFKGKIVQLTHEQAIAQRTPLPLLFTDKDTYGPSSIQAYFQSISKK